MAKAYWVVCYRAIKNPDKLAAYAKLAAPAIQAHDSPGYQEALRVLGDAVERDLRIIEGVS